MSTNELVWSLLGVTVLVWFFFDSLRVREKATVLCRQACDYARVQFLDDTVALVRLGVCRSEQGLVWRRIYQFEYLDDRSVDSFTQYALRGKGWIILQGTRLENLTLEIKMLE